MNQAKRYAARQIIHHINTTHYGTYHELYRVANVEKEGLTEKEQAFLKKTLDQLMAVNERLSKFGTHIQGTL